MVFPEKNQMQDEGMQVEGLQNSHKRSKDIDESDRDQAPKRRKSKQMIEAHLMGAPSSGPASQYATFAGEQAGGMYPAYAPPAHNIVSAHPANMTHTGHRSLHSSHNHPGYASHSSHFAHPGYSVHSGHLGNAVYTAHLGHALGHQSQPASMAMQGRGMQMDPVEYQYQVAVHKHAVPQVVPRHVATHRTRPNISRRNSERHVEIAYFIYYKQRQTLGGAVPTASLVADRPGPAMESGGHRISHQGEWDRMQQMRMHQESSGPPHYASHPLQNSRPSELYQTLR
eukprot:gb/GEZN01010121.1/.p1 GENE.gb/GEZN01010121.1/~~gb/GEZN01010121.1/.p1  ORF type:complete len:284 (-),score=20.65 gb/GEZN01010121.1/:148-999(-)